MLEKIFLKIPFHLKIAIIAWTARLIMAVVQVFSVRFFISYLGVDSYAGFAIITSLGGWFALVEFGLGPTLQNFISEWQITNKDVNSIIINANVIVFTIIIITIIILSVLSNSIQAFLFGKAVTLKKQTFNIVWLAGFLYILNYLCGISYRVYYAQKKGHLSNIFPAIGSIVSFVAIIIVDLFFKQKGDLFLSILLFIGPTTFMAMIAYYDVFLKEGRLSLNKFDKSIIILILSRSYKFAIFSTLAAIVLYTDYIVMSRVLSPIDIIKYNIISKIYMFIFFIYSAILMALWPQLTKLLKKKQYEFVKKYILKHLYLGFAIIFLGTIVLLFFKNNIVIILSNAKIDTVHYSTIVLFGLYYSLRVWSDTYAVLLQSMSKMKMFIIYVPIQGVISFLCQYFCGIKFGLNGIIIGLIVSFITTSVWILPYSYKKIVKSDGSML